MTTAWIRDGRRERTTTALPFDHRLDILDNRWPTQRFVYAIRRRDGVAEVTGCVNTLREVVSAVQTWITGSRRRPHV